MNELILLVEDNEQILRGNERMLRRRGYKVAAALTLAEARRLFAEKTLGAIVLDIMLPDGNGLDFMREVRAHKVNEKSNVPILLLTGLSAPEDVVRFLSEGGDDYLAKPYDFDVLQARIEALLRRSGRIPETLSKGPLRLDLIAHRAYFNGDDLLLSQKEFSLLLMMAQNEDRLLSAEYLYNAIWKQQAAADTSAVRTAVSRLRGKLGGDFIIENDKQEGGYIFSHIK